MISLSQQTVTEGDKERDRLCGGDERKDKRKTKGIEGEGNKGRGKADGRQMGWEDKSKIWDGKLRE